MRIDRYIIHWHKLKIGILYINSTPKPLIARQTHYLRIKAQQLETIYNIEHCLGDQDNRIEKFRNS